MRLPPAAAAARCERIATLSGLGSGLLRAAERRAGAGGDRQRAVADLEDVFGDALHQAADEGVEVTGVATLDEHRVTAAGQPAADVARLQLSAQHRPDRVEQDLERERSGVGVECRQLVRFEVQRPRADRP